MTPRLRHPHTQAGSAAVEVALGVPVFLLLIAVVVLGGRVAITHQAVQSAAADAARAASLARTAASAHADASQAADASLTNQQISCTAIGIDVDTSGFQVPVGTPATVAATVSCTVPVDDLGIPGVGPRTITATMSSPLDTFRGRR